MYCRIRRGSAAYGDRSVRVCRIRSKNRRGNGGGVNNDIVERVARAHQNGRIAAPIGDRCSRGQLHARDRKRRRRNIAGGNSIAEIQRIRAGAAGGLSHRCSRERVKTKSAK